MSENLYRIVSEIEKKRIFSELAKGKRIDGREIEDYRELTVETGVVEKAEGSARVTLGKTQVVAGVKVDIGSPYSDTPDSGVVTVNAELTPLASPMFEFGPPDENSIEVARVVDRGIRHAEVVNKERLCIIPGEKVWIIFVDVYALDYDGNLFDASTLAAVSALLTAKIPKVKVDGDEVTVLDELEPLPIESEVVSTTMARINNQFVVDPILKEELVMDGRITISVDKDKKVTSIQKGGVGPLPYEDAINAIEIGVKKAKELLKKLPKR